VRSRYHDLYDLSTCYTGAKMEEQMTRIRCTSIALGRVLLRSLSPGHTSGATTVPATPPKEAGHAWSPRGSV